MIFQRFIAITPNKLTLLRIILIPVLVVCIYYKMKSIAVSIFVIAAITDYFDGFLARRYNQTTELGKVLDPVADKLLVSTCLFLLIWRGTTGPIVPIIITCRDILVDGLKQYSNTEGIKLDTLLLAKIKTAILYAAIFFLLQSPDLEDIGMIALMIGLVLSIVSGVQYFVIYKKKLRKHKGYE
jgi:cardiolipin synthase